MEINPNTMRFRDRSEVGRALAKALLRYADQQGVTVRRLPRGGVPVAYEVARRPPAPLIPEAAHRDRFPERRRRAAEGQGAALHCQLSIFA